MRMGAEPDAHDGKSVFGSELKLLCLSLHVCPPCLCPMLYFLFPFLELSKPNRNFPWPENWVSLCCVHYYTAFYPQLLPVQVPVCCCALRTHLGTGGLERSEREAGDTASSLEEAFTRRVGLNTWPHDRTATSSFSCWESGQRAERSLFVEIPLLGIYPREVGAYVHIRHTQRCS